MAWSGVSFCKNHGLIYCDECEHVGYRGADSPACLPEDNTCFDGYSKGANMRNVLRSMEKHGRLSDPTLKEWAKKEWKRSRNEDNSKFHDLAKEGHPLIK